MQGGCSFCRRWDWPTELSNSYFNRPSIQILPLSPYILWITCLNLQYKAVSNDEGTRVGVRAQNERDNRPVGVCSRALGRLLSLFTILFVDLSYCYGQASTQSENLL